MRFLVLLWLAISLALSPLAQVSPDPTREWRAFRSVLNLLNDHELERALPELERFKKSPVPEIAARSSLELGAIYMDVKRDPDRALSYLSEIVKNPAYHSLASLWATATFRTGQLKLARATTRAQLLEAQSDFDRIYRAYPETSVSADALFASALLAERLQDYDGAVEKYRRIRTEYSNSRSTPQALFNLARHYAFKGDTKAALIQLQEIRNRFPESEHAKQALAASAGLYRFYRRTLLSGGTLYGAPREVGISDVKELLDPHSLLVNSAGELFLVDRLKKYAFKFLSDGRVLQTLPVLEPTALALGPDDGLYVADLGTVRRVQAKDPPTWKLTTTASKGDARPLRRITSLAVDSGGDFYAVDADSRGVIKYSTVTRRGEVFASQQGLRHVRQVLVDALDHVYLLDEKEGKVLVFSALGDPIGQIRIAGSGRGGGAVAMALDTLNHLYVLDRSGTFYVYELSYPSSQNFNAKLVTGVPFTGRFKEGPQAFAVSRSGRVFITGKKSGSVLVFP